MTNFSSVQMTSAPTTAELEALRIQVEAPRAAPVQTPGRVSGRISFQAGQERVESFGVTRVEIRNRQPGLVDIPGVGTTTREAAIAAGFDVDGESADPLPAGRKAAGSPTPNGDTLDADKAADADDGPPPEIVNASAILTKAVEVHGGDVVDAGLAMAAEAGEIPTSLPEGMTPADAATVWNGYTAQAENTLGKVGANVALLSEMLSDEEQTKARMATFYQDAGYLQDLGKRAQRRLETLPQVNRARFEEALATMSEADRKMVRQGEDGSWRVALPAALGGEISWGLAVRSGRVKF